jgi:hypothetical protein
MDRQTRETMNEIKSTLEEIIGELEFKRDHWIGRISASNSEEANASYDDTAYGLQLAINVVTRALRELY